jgi:hypothetical protein
MRACWRFAGGKDFRDGIGVSFWIVFFVFFFEPARVFAGVAWTAMGTGFGRIVTGHELNPGPFGERMNFVLELSHRLIG